MLRNAMQQPQLFEHSTDLPLQLAVAMIESLDYAEAEQLLETHHLESVLAAARLARGKIIGGDAGRELIARAESWIAQEHTSPELMRVLVAMLLLGLQVGQKAIYG